MGDQLAARPLHAQDTHTGDTQTGVHASSGIRTEIQKFGKSMAFREFAIAATVTAAQAGFKVYRACAVAVVTWSYTRRYAVAIQTLGGCTVGDKSQRRI